jgi:hypothetical protein
VKLRPKRLEIRERKSVKAIRAEKNKYNAMELSQIRQKCFMKFADPVEVRPFIIIINMARIIKSI